MKIRAFSASTIVELSKLIDAANLHIHHISITAVNWSRENTKFYAIVKIKI